MSARPKLCVSCGKLMGVVTTCPYCGSDNNRIAVRLKRLAAPGDGSAFSVTTALITVNLFLYGTALVVGGIGGGSVFDFLTPDYEVLFRIGIQDNRAIDAGQWWRLFLMMFLHLGVLHVAFNCYILYFAGSLLEHEFGARLTFLIYLSSGLAGSVGSYFAGIGGAGASGAVFGLLGAILVRRRLVDGHFSHPVTRQIVWLLGLNVVLAFFMGGHINHVAHGGGFLAGAAGAWFLTSVRVGRAGAAALMLATWALGAATAGAFALMILSLFHGGPTDVLEADRCWRSAVRSVAPGFDPAAAEKALDCVGQIADLEPPANEARGQAEAGLRAALAAYDAGDASRLEQASTSVVAAHARYATWQREAVPRYGLRLMH